eukprot:TRINITY_DN6468_c0_g2_i1.p1 TRINITY_DN6468_c0_g2~~TRINITY_DN6468_c0_g2_i1.p1  ORF type:complete len:544 (+),score=203.50 TRINITY_DN6468_c0_g2_i1:107-1738(+)
MEFTRQQMCGAKDYNMRTFTGNWNEDVARESDRMREFMRRRAAGELTTQKVQRRMKAHLEQLTLTPQHPDGYLRFGDVVCIQSAQTRGFVSLDMLRPSQGRPGHYDASVGASPVPVLRNVWILKKWKDPHAQFFKKKKEHDIVHYGQKLRIINPFIHECHLSLCSELPGPGTSKQGNDNGKARSEVTACEGGLFECVWTVQPGERRWDMEEEGRPVKTGDVIVIRSAKACQPLCAEDGRRCATSFGDEVDIAVLHCKGQHNKHNLVPNEPQNLWAFICAPAGSTFVPYKPERVTDALSRVKAKILQRGGSTGFRGLVRTLRIMDDDGNRKLSRRELKDGMATYGVHLDAGELDHVFQAFDRDGDGVITITEFLRTLRGPMNQRRRDLVLLAYERLDKNLDGVVTFGEIRKIYEEGTKHHPAVLDGSKTPEEVMREFIANSWDKNKDGTITQAEFLEYYNDISVNIDNDDYFELMIRNAWHISGGEGWCANTSCRRVLVIHQDGSQTVEEIKDDLGIGPEDIDKMRANLEAQGITDIKEIRLTH